MASAAAVASSSVQRRFLINKPLAAADNNNIIARAPIILNPRFFSSSFSLSFAPPRNTTLRLLLLPSPTPAAAAASSYFSDGDDYYEEDEDDEELELDKTEAAAAAAEASTSKPTYEAAAGRLYVGNLPYSMTPSQLADIFCQAGSVEGVEVVYDRVTDRSRGFAFITMATADDANNAIRMFDGAQQVGGRTVKVNFPEVPRGGERAVMGPRIRDSNRGFVDSPYKVYAGNLSWSVTSESLRMAFRGQQGLLGARVIYDRDSGRSRGYGFISFASSEDVQSAIDAMNGVELEGRPLRLSLAAERAVAVDATPFPVLP